MDNDGFVIVTYKREKKELKDGSILKRLTRYPRPEIRDIFAKIKETLIDYGAIAVILYGSVTTHKKEIGDIDMMIFWKYSYLPEELTKMKYEIEYNIGIPIDFVVMQRNAGCKKYRPHPADEFFFQNVVTEGRIMFVDETKAKLTKSELVYSSTKILKL